MENELFIALVSGGIGTAVAGIGAFIVNLYTKKKEAHIQANEHALKMLQNVVDELQQQLIDQKKMFIEYQKEDIAEKKLLKEKIKKLEEENEECAKRNFKLEQENEVLVARVDVLTKVVAKYEPKSDSPNKPS